MKAAAEIGVSRAVLCGMCARGELLRAAQGVYVPPDEIVDELAVVAGRSGNIVFSHETALALHGLHNRIPSVPSLTLPTGARLPRSLDGRVRTFHVKPELHGMGVELVKTFCGNEVTCCGVERTICDLVRSRSRIDVETYSGALKRYAAGTGRNLPLLMEYAERMGIARKVHMVMETLT